MLTPTELILFLYVDPLGVVLYADIMECAPLRNFGRNKGLFDAFAFSSIQRVYGIKPIFNETY
jgi:hypothetical protein